MAVESVALAAGWEKGTEGEKGDRGQGMARAVNWTCGLAALSACSLCRDPVHTTPPPPSDGRSASQPRELLGNCVPRIYIKRTWTDGSSS